MLERIKFKFIFIYVWRGIFQECTLFAKQYGNDNGNGNGNFKSFLVAFTVDVRNNNNVS